MPPVSLPERVQSFLERGVRTFPRRPGSGDEELSRLTKEQNGDQSPPGSVATAEPISYLTMPGASP